MDFDTSMNRRRVLQLGSGLGFMTLLAACGSDTSEGTSGGEPASSEAAPASSAAAPASSEAAPASSAAGGESSAAAPESSAGGASSAAAPAFDPSTEKGALEVFDWVGYDDKSGPFWDYYTKGPYGKSNPLKFSFLEDDQQALAKVAAGYKTDLSHPCIAYARNWQEAGLIQPWTTSAINQWDSINPKLYEAGVVDGQVYAVPWDWGYSSLVYRGDRVQPAEESWNILLDSKYKGRIGFFSDGVAIIKVGGLINGVSDPNAMTDDEIQAAKETMIKAKPQSRTFWTNQTDAIKEVVAGNMDITYGWPDAWLSIKKELPNADVQYMQPKEGRLAWICSYVLSKDTPRPGLAHEMMSSITTPENAVALIDVYGYGAAGASAPGVLDKVQNKELIKTFGLDDLDAALQPPKVWLEEYLPNRSAYVKAAEEVKAA